MPLLRRLAVAGLLVLAAGCAGLDAGRLAQQRLALHPVALEELEGTAFAGFRTPAQWDEAGGLYLLEPYRPGAVPVVLVHGLVSDPSTWAEMHAALRADPAVADRFQFWAFSYATGRSYLDSAARLREELCRVRKGLDPAGADAALSRVVLVGHSMGGLVSRLQVTHSGEALSRIVYEGSLDDLALDVGVRAGLERATRFLPQPGVTRAVYIAAPHRGSDEASGRLAKIGRRLVTFPAPMRAGYEALRRGPAGQLMRLPPRPPTSVDLLEPGHPVLCAVASLPTGAGVSEHTILGVGERTRGAGRCGDGYVSARSASLPWATSELRLEGAHTEVHRLPAAAAEVRRILMRHLAEGA